MNVPLYIDTSSLFEDYDISKQQVDDVVDLAVKEITAEFASQWEKTALDGLGSTKMRYTQNLKVVDEGRMMGAVVLDYTKDPLVQMLEEGASAFDMKEGFLRSSKAKTGKDGKKYITIPFSWGTPDSVSATQMFSNKMPTEVYSVAKTKSEGKSVTSGDLKKLGGSFDIPKSRAKIEIPKSKTFEEYTHKSSIYQGITKGTSSVTGQSSYTSFRRVSEYSSPNSFIHPGITANNFADKALDEFDNKVPMLLSRAVDGALKSMGFE